MGSNTSSELARDEARKVKECIARKCDCYVIAIEHTNSVVDVKLQGLRKEISDLVNPLRELPCVRELGMLGMSAILEDVENFANEHKFLIEKMLEIMFETQNKFEEMCQRHMNETSIEVAPDNEMLDENCMAEMRSAIENIVKAYECELNNKGIPIRYQAKRGDELRRLLFNLAETTVSETVEGLVQELKDSSLEEVDNDLCLGMISGHFSDVATSKEALKQIITKSIIARASLEALPFSRRVDIEAAQDEVALHVDQLVRRIQMNHVHSAKDLVTIMNLDLYDSGKPSSDSASALNSEEESDDDDQETEEEGDRDEEEEVVVSVKLNPSRSRPSTTTNTTKPIVPSSAADSAVDSADDSADDSVDEESSGEEEVPTSTSKRGTKRKAVSTRGRVAAKTAPAGAAKRAKATPKKGKQTKATPSTPPAGRGKRLSRVKKLE